MAVQLRVLYLHEILEKQVVQEGRLTFADGLGWQEVRDHDIGGTHM